jgi:hypothetical protein
MRWGILLLAAGCGLAEGPTEKALVARYDPSTGKASSAVSFDGVRIDAMAAHPAGGVIVAGALHTGSSSASNPHHATFGNLQLTPSADHLDAFVARLDDAGNVAWVVQGAAQGNAHVASLAIGPGGEVIAGGEFAKAITFAGLTIHMAAQGALAAPTDPFVLSTDASGTLKWASNPIPDMSGGFVGGVVDHLAIVSHTVAGMSGWAIAGSVTAYPTGVALGVLDSTGGPLGAIPVKADLKQLNVGATALAVDGSGAATLAGFDAAGGFVVKYPSVDSIIAMGVPMSASEVPMLWSRDPFVAAGRADVTALATLADGTLMVGGNADSGSTVGTTASPNHSLFLAHVDATAAGNITNVALTGSPSGGAWFNFAATATQLYATGIALGSWLGNPAGSFLAAYDLAGNLKWANVPQLDESMNMQGGTLRPLTVAKDGTPIIAAQYRLAAQLDAITLK